MFFSNRLLNWIATIALFVTVSGCGGLGSGCGCSMDPLPAGGLPKDQTIEGGGQIRVTPAGFQKLTSLIPAVINDTLGGGFCIPKSNILDNFVGSADFCGANDGICTPGCQVDFHVDSINLAVANNVLKFSIQFDVATDARIDYDVLLVASGSCSASFAMNNAAFTMDIAMGIDPADGELTLSLAGVSGLNLTGISITPNCGGLGNTIINFIGSALDIFATLMNSFIGDLILDLLAPLLDDFIQGLLPDPLGIEGLLNAGDLVSGVSPGTKATMEMRGVPGGYVQLVGNGLSLGLITGFNADEDISTRTADLDSEPAFCVPPMVAPDFSAPPASLPKSSRQTFTLAPANEFLGAPDPAADLAIGLSETTLDLVGHHAVTSGTMCLGIGTTLIPQLNLGTIGILVPSLSELGSEDGTDPLLLVTRPQKAIDFTVGQGTAASPALTIHLTDFEVDFYAFLYERYVRGFTLALTMNVGINLEFTTDMMGNPAILPTLVGLSTDEIQLTVHNSEFLRESPDTLEQVLPAIFDLALPLIADGLDAITLPDFAGFTLTNLSVKKVTTTEDDFLALYATLGASAMTKQLGETYPSIKALFVEEQLAENHRVPAVATARLRSVDRPAPAFVRMALQGHENGRLPSVAIDADTHDLHGRELEWTWNINGGMWRPFISGSPLVISDRAFAMQGKFTIELRSRAKGDYLSISEDIISIPVVIDSVGPRLLGSKTKVEGNDLVVKAHDLVSGTKVLYAFGRRGDDRPWTDYQASGTIALAEVQAIVGADQVLTVWMKDELGNESSSDFDLGPVVGFHGTPSEGGCGCATGPSTGGQAGGLALLFGLTGLLLLRRRRSLGWLTRVATRQRLAGLAVWAGLATAISLTPGCSCSSAPADLSCETDAECVELCPETSIPLCFDNQCVCADDVPFGRIGQYSDMSLASDGSAWVSAYASSHGDLVVANWPGSGRIDNSAWEFVDGVPDGPVVLPDSEIRGGIFDPGPDTGKYTSIAVGPGDVPMVSYFDAATSSLKFARKDGETWNIHVVDEGNTQGDPELGFETTGLYSSLTLRSDDGRPAIAYLAVIKAGGNIRTEVRFASAQSTTPGSSLDWNTWVVDSAEVMAPEVADPTQMPNGTGLFVQAARLSDQRPVVVYYDRVNGDLKLSRFDTVAGTFQTPEVLDGADGADVGWYPGVFVDSSDEVHVSYVSATFDDLLYVNTATRTPEVIDDGYRLVGTTADGLPKPEFHFVGDDSNIVLAGGSPMVVYQDATSHELLMSQRGSSDTWEYMAVAGDEDPFTGAYGFYASAELGASELVISNWVINQPENDTWVELHRLAVVVE